MEPLRRVLGLGSIMANADGSIRGLVFDVSDLSKPTMLSRVNFGGTWGQLPEDQDRIHKVFRVLEDLGLILVPYTGYQVDTDSRECGGRSVGGVQLMDYRNDTLTLRGSADSPGETRRALVHRDHLLAVSDQRIESFSIANRDAPKKVGQSVLASNVIHAQQLADGVVARVTTPAWDGRYFVEFVAAAEAEDANARLSELSLEGVIDDESSVCRRWWSLNSVPRRRSTCFVHSKVGRTTTTEGMASSGTA